MAAGDLLRLPYLVMEYVPGQTLQHWLDQPERPDAATVAQLGSVLLFVHFLIIGVERCGNVGTECAGFKQHV